MKRLKLKLVALCLGVFAFSGCSSDDDTAHHFDNKLFLDIQNPVDEMVFRAGDESVQTRTLTASLALAAETDIQGTFVKAPSLVETYNQIYNAQAEVLPNSMCTIEKPEATIVKGAVKSEPVTVSFSNMGALDKDKLYVMPIELKGATGIDLLSSKTRAYFVFKGASLINVVADLKENRSWPDFNGWSELSSMRNFTLEALIYGNAFKNQIATVMGIEGKFLIRAGDAGLPGNQIQIAASSNLTSSDLQLETGKWYHLAVTFSSGNVVVYLNGVKKLEGNCGTTSVNFGVAHSDEDNGKPRCFWIGYSYNTDRYWDGMISEVRIWNKTLTADEINAENHFYTVDPASEGLKAYWKFDEGTGKAVKDQTGNGHDLTSENDLKWVNVELPEPKK